MFQLLLLPFRLSGIFLAVLAIGLYFGGLQLDQIAKKREATLEAMIATSPPDQVGIAAFAARNSTTRDQEVNLSADWAYGHNTRFVTTKNGAETEEGVMIVLMDDNAEGAPTVRAVAMTGPGQGEALIDWLNERRMTASARPDTVRVEVQGLVSRPVLRSRVNDALSEAGLTKADGFFYITPFVNGREATIRDAAGSGVSLGVIAKALAAILGFFAAFKLFSQFGGGIRLGSAVGGRKPSREAAAAEAAKADVSRRFSSFATADPAKTSDTSDNEKMPAAPQTERTGAPWSPPAALVEEEVMRPIANSSSQDFIANIRARDTVRVEQEAQIAKPVAQSGSSAWSNATGAERVSYRGPVQNGGGSSAKIVMQVVGTVLLIVIALGWFSVNRQGGFGAMLERARGGGEVEMTPIAPAAEMPAPAAKDGATGEDAAAEGPARIAP